MSKSIEMKHRLRTQIQKQSTEYSAEYRKKASWQILVFLKQWSVFQQSRVIHSFLSRAAEPDTFAIIQYGWKLKKQMVVPYVLSDSGGLLGHSLLESFDQLSAGYAGISEPRPEARQPVNLDYVDLILVPGVAVDLNGGRLGHGKGYYDRFLEKLSVFRVGLAFQFQVVETVPQDAHDVPMDGLLTEQGFRLTFPVSL